jgi:hypothetical protein
MGDIDEEYSIFDGTRLGLKSHRLAHNLLPGPQDGIGL